MDNRQAFEQALDALQRQIYNANVILSTYQKRLNTFKITGKDKTKEYSELAQKIENLKQVIAKYEKFYDERKQILESPGVPIRKRRKNH